MPVAFISTRTSPAFGPSRSTSTISSGFFASKATAAFVFIVASLIGQVRLLLDRRVGDAVTVARVAGAVRSAWGAVEFVADRFQLSLFERGDADSLPTLGGADERGVHFHR